LVAVTAFKGYFHDLHFYPSHLETKTGRLDNILKKIFFAFLILSDLLLQGCTPARKDGFAIYLLSEEFPPANLTQTDINQLILQDSPIISDEDIVSYDQSNHIIELTSDAYARVQRIFPMPVRVEGIPFVVCVGKERIYTGVLMTPASSISYDGVVIGQPLDKAKTTIQITLGYPSQEAFTGIDPRTDSRIMESLEQSNKLK